MSRAFLTPRGPAPCISPLRARLAGARFEVRDGWEVAVRFADPAAEAQTLRDAVGWADVSHLGKLEVSGGAAPALADRSAERVDDAWWCPLGPGRALVFADGARTADLRERLGNDAVDVTTQYGALVIAGPVARELFARFCALDLRPRVTPAGSFRPGSIARTPGFVLCTAPDRYLWLFGAAYGEYVWEVISDAGERLGGRPVGVDALREEAPVRA
jgi:glycine cleavage system aminomethyltransferase T